ncbi:PREDICTED: uncharacterized protein LOC108756535 [Trachymyrmex septentrionalis]|uniref:uncharacterized protein LOC108756535 n=1 Tax=Trachymyrmex septentrionalis TaxID=34720 RepID=UPI00084F5D3E|nr:PREDICTED: uncharacterized protein LOC108756535 [Trachymyrmex septentrionalis]
MIVATFIPFFLAVQLPIEDGAWRYGPEYIFTVHMNMTGTPQCSRSACGNPSGYRITSRLHCIPKRNNTLICSLRYVDGFDFGMIGEEDNTRMNRRKNITEAPIELLFDEKGIENIITSQLTRTYDLNILKIVAEQLHPGDNFNNIGDGTFEGETASTIGRCNATFDVYYHSGAENPNETRFRLKLLPPKLHITSTETLIINKQTNLNHCSCYADNYFGKYGDTIVHQRLQADLNIMISHMEIGETSFSSSTTRKGTSVSNYKTYNIIEITTIILEDIQPAARDPIPIVNPGETKILANHDIRSIPTSY